MIIHKNFLPFLEMIYVSNLDFKPISESELRKKFKNNEYYKLKFFCVEKGLIIIEHHKINLTSHGVNLFKILKTMNNI